MKKTCLIAPAIGEVTVTVVDCEIELLASTAAVAVYVVVAVGFTLAVPLGKEHGLHMVLPEPSVIVSDAAVPLLISQLSVDAEPDVTVAGEAVRVNVNGTVTVTVEAADVPPGPVAVMENVVVVFTGTSDDPETDSGPESSGTGTAGVIVTVVALFVAQVSVVVWPAFTNIGFAVNCVTCGSVFCATCTVTVCGLLLPCEPVATAV